MTVSSIQAQTITWTGATDSVWHTATNWNPANIPTATNDVIIPVGTSISPTISASAVANSVVIKGMLTIASGDLTIDGTIGNAIQVNSGGNLTNDGDINLGLNSLIDGEGLVNTGTVVNLSLIHI